MAALNSTTTLSLSISSGISICQDLGELKDPANATPASLASSFSIIVVSTITCPLSVPLNILILLSFYKKPALRTQANVLLGAMAVINLIHGAIGYPVFLVKEIFYQMRLQPSCYLNFILFNNSPILVPLLTAANCSERFLGIRYPIWHRVHVTNLRLVLVAVFSFFIAESVSLLRSFVGGIITRLLVMLLFGLCTVLTVVFAALIWQVILRRNQEIDPLHHQPSASATSSERKAAKIATYLGFAFVFTRVFPLLMLATVLGNQDLQYIAEPLTFGPYLMDSLITPLICGLTNQNIKKACLEIVRCNRSF